MDVRRLELTPGKVEVICSARSISCMVNVEAGCGERSSLYRERMVLSTSANMVTAGRSERGGHNLAWGSSAVVSR